MPAHRRQAVRGRQRARTRRSSAGSRPARPNDDVAKLPKVVAVELYPKNGGARRQEADAADDRPGQVLRRHRPRRHPALRLPHQQRHLRRDHADGLVTAGDRGEAFVMARFETFTVGSQVIVLPKGLKFEYPAEPEVELHRHARRRQAQEAADRPLGRLRRRDLPPPGLPRRRRPAADRRGVRASSWPRPPPTSGPS